MPGPDDPSRDAPRREEPHANYAMDRTVLANERTYAAWVRTGLTALAAGVAIEKFMVDVIPGWGIRSIAVILICFSALSFSLAAWRYTHLGIKLADADVKAVPAAVTTGASLVLVVCALIALAGLWLVAPSVGR